MASPREADVAFMREAVRLAARARGKTAPNPLVGSVVVRGKRGIARGYHRRAGLPPGEAVALARAGAGARGATLYVTLEPCLMCAGALINGRVERVVFGAADPKAGACGSLYQVGLDSRLNHRFDVEGGLLEEECGAILRQFFMGRRK